MIFKNKTIKYKRTPKINDKPYSINLSDKIKLPFNIFDKRAKITSGAKSSPGSKVNYITFSIDVYSDTFVPSCRYYKSELRFGHMLDYISGKRIKHSYDSYIKVFYKMPILNIKNNENDIEVRTKNNNIIIQNTPKYISSWYCSNIHQRVLNFDVPKKILSKFNQKKLDEKLPKEESLWDFS